METQDERTRVFEYKMFILALAWARVVGMPSETVRQATTVMDQTTEMLKARGDDVESFTATQQTTIAILGMLAARAGVTEHHLLKVEETAVSTLDMMKRADNAVNN